MSGKRWKGIVLGAAGSVFGLMAMRAYWQHLAPQVSSWMKRYEDDSEEKPKTESGEISLVGVQYEEGESATAAVGRILYRWLTGREPRAKESREMLSYLVHWGYGMFQGGLYGYLRRGGGPLSGQSYATLLWLLGDEIAVPMLGLQPGPASASTTDHLNRLGAHWAYGLGTGTAAGLLNRLL